MITRSTTRFAALLLATALLAGCATVGPDYVVPTIKSNADFNNRMRLVPPAAADLATWWRGFNDPLLDTIVERTLAQNLDLAQAIARVEQARAATGAARAALLPNGVVSGSAGSAMQSQRTQLGRLGEALGADRSAGQFDSNLGIGWDLDLFGGLKRGREATRADYEAAGADAAAARIGVVAEAVDTYILVRTFQLRLGVARDQITMQRDLVGIIKLQRERGLTSQLRLDQAAGSLAGVEASVPLLENGLQISMNALDVLCGNTPGTGHSELQSATAIPSAPSVQSAGGPAALLRRRPDIIAAERRLAASNSRIGTAIAGYYPSVSLSGLLGVASTTSSGLLTSRAGQTQAVAGVRWRLFDFGRVDAEVDEAKGRNAEALAAFRLSILRATEDVENAFDALEKREQQAALLGTGEAALTRARTASLAAYRGGVVSLVEVLDADDRLLQTRDARIIAQSEAARAAVASFRALGGGWQG